MGEKDEGLEVVWDGLTNFLGENWVIDWIDSQKGGHKKLRNIANIPAKYSENIRVEDYQYLYLSC